MTERGGRVFPESGRAYDVAEFFRSRITALKIPVLYEYDVKKLLTEGGRVTGTEGMLRGKTYVLHGRTVLIAAGGSTYRRTGSDGSGYLLALGTGHGIVPPRPSLTGLKCRESGECGALSGLTLKNIELRLYEADKAVFKDFGELLFTEHGISGPTVLTMSAEYVTRALNACRPESDKPVYDRAALAEYLKRSDSVFGGLNADGRFRVEIDLKPALDEKTLDDRLLREIEANRRKKLKNSLDALLPQSLIPVVIARSGISPEIDTGSISKVQRAALLKVLKRFALTPLGPDDPDHGIVTAGGVSLKEVDPGKYSSKLTEGLFFAGEVLDIDALTGGFNLTLAFSTGRAAGEGIHDYCLTHGR